MSLQNGSRPGRTRRRRKNVNNKIDKQREELDEMMGVDESNAKKFPCSILLMYFDVVSEFPYKWKVEAISRACTPRRPMLLLEVHFVEIFFVAHFAARSQQLQISCHPGMDVKRREMASLRRAMVALCSGADFC